MHMLERIRITVRKALAQSDETIAYDMPTYKIDSKAVVDRLRAKIAPFEVEKSTIRIPIADEPIALIIRFAELRREDVASRLVYTCASRNVSIRPIASSAAPRS